MRRDRLRLRYSIHIFGLHHFAADQNQNVKMSF